MRLRSRERDGPHVSSAATMSSGDCGNGYNEGVVVTNTHQSQQTFARRKQYGGQLPLKEDSSMKNAHTVSQSGYYVSHESLHTMAPFDQNDSASGNTNSANVTPANEGHNDGLSDVQTGAQGWSKHMAMNMHLSSHSGTNAYMFKTSKH